jgi:hypothetical protein
LEWAEVESRLDQSPFKARLTEHFQADPATYPVTGESVATYDLPNLQLALDAHLGENGRDHELIGFGGHVGYAEMSLAGLVHDLASASRRDRSDGPSCRSSAVTRSPASRPACS